MERGDICVQENARVNKLALSPPQLKNHRIYILPKEIESQEALIPHEAPFFP